MISYYVEVDVASAPDQATQIVRDFMEKNMPDVKFGGPVQRAGTVKLIRADGPAGGNPLVGCRFRMRNHAREFVRKWYGHAEIGFVEEQIKQQVTGPQ